ncbi:MAG: hypothetical protein A2787_01870 [Omnitrophica WOR_2 bacterium RIFCSPHIGHO2_01_FULL_48_9]|nr:MAG: hypothetical protein A2787_01870 [Omnitrophica WOR_2 bacterium RIFCSPHIGHO2_01_FULL_48_9]
MKERRIALSHIQKALKEPFAILPTIDKKRKRVMAKVNNKTIDVIYAQRKDVYIVITVAWLNQEDRKVCP